MLHTLSLLDSSSRGLCISKDLVVMVIILIRAEKKKMLAIHSDNHEVGWNIVKPLVYTVFVISWKEIFC